ncbi:ribosome recycling factor [Levilactobacillus bambusae]
MQKAEAALERELGTIRAGRANASLLNNVTVDYYGAPTPLNQIAAITIPEARVLLVKPYDKSALNDIEHGIYAANVGLTPANDGEEIRLVVPALTEERRQEIAKQVKATAEQGKVAVRNVRRDAMDTLKRGHKDGDYTDDEWHKLEDQVQKETDTAIKAVEQIASDKEKEILEG